jgi:hypothetical protein
MPRHRELFACAASQLGYAFLHSLFLLFRQGDAVRSISKHAATDGDADGYAVLVTAMSTDTIEWATTGDGAVMFDIEMVANV